MRLPAFMSLAFSWKLQCRREATDGTTGIVHFIYFILYYL
jgi:hypothetical protein